jgi:3-methyladenine DNA glycosylase AlkD
MTPGNRPRTKPATGVREVVDELRRLAPAGGRAALERFGIPSHNALGIPTPALKALARRLGRDHGRAAALWNTGLLDARILAALTEEVEFVTPTQMEAWAREFDSWAVCDGACCHVFVHTPHAWTKAAAWARRRAEFVKRAGFALMAYLAVHDKAAPDDAFLPLLVLIEQAAGDDRLYVKKAVNWALRQIGKRNLTLHRQAVATAQAILKRETATARWIARDALRELTNPAVLNRLARRRDNSRNRHK